VPWTGKQQHKHKVQLQPAQLKPSKNAAQTTAKQQWPYQNSWA
jgi:hypothetical protein